jgi:hypothetical protein
VGRLPLVVALALLAASQVLLVPQIQVVVVAALAVAVLAVL